jgi:predicted nucleic acid-binding protein
MFLLDTNVVSELRKAASGKADANVVQWASSVSSSSLYISVITLMELRTGILLKERKDHEQGQLLHVWFNTKVLPAFENRVIPIDTEVALKCSSLHVPDRRSDRDTFIAASAIVHGMTVVTRNVKDFAGVKADILNPWEN